MSSRSSNMPRKSFLCYHFILEQPGATAALWLESFFFYLDIVSAYCCHSRKAETRGCLCSVTCLSFHSTCPDWASLICPVTTQLLREFSFSSSISFPTHVPVQQSTFLSSFSCYAFQALFFQWRFPWLCSAPLRHTSAYTSWHWCHAKFININIFVSVINWSNVKNAAFWLEKKKRDGFQDVTRSFFSPSEEQLMIIELISLKQVTSHLPMLPPESYSENV